MSECSGPNCTHPNHIHPRKPFGYWLTESKSTHTRKWLTKNQIRAKRKKGIKGY